MSLPLHFTTIASAVVVVVAVNLAAAGLGVLIRNSWDGDINLKTPVEGYGFYARQTLWIVQDVKRVGYYDGDVGEVGGETPMSSLPVKGNAKRSFGIRKAEARDAPGILVCLAASFAPYREQYTPDGFADTVLTAETVGRRLHEMQVFVAVCNDEIVGTIGCHVAGEEGHLRGMAVLPKWQGSGVAAALLGAAEAELRNSHCKRVTLDTTAPLQRAVRFYERQGFSPSGRVSDFFGMPLYEYVKSL